MDLAGCANGTEALIGAGYPKKYSKHLLEIDILYNFLIRNSCLIEKERLNQRFTYEASE